jgi:phosphatidylglycerol lysyltransferase
VIARQPFTSPNLVYLGDKSLLWNQDRSGLVMYAVCGSSWVALGDPVGPPDRARDLVYRFLSQAEAHGVTPVFYEASAARLGDYIDLGLRAVKIGEEARVPLSGFTLAGGAHKSLRAALNRMQREGIGFRIVQPPEVDHLIRALQEVSDEWLAMQRAGEKGFSLGFFDPAYVRRFPVAVIERDGRIEAFATMWPGQGRFELSPDLMRHRAQAPRIVMDALFAQMMLWGREQGYQWFNLGMAPLSGLPHSPLGRSWSRVGRFAYRHGELFYNFQGLRAYKEKFDPVWEPRYLVYPGGLMLPKVLADVTALVAGGYRQIFWRTGGRAA